MSIYLSIAVDVSIRFTDLTEKSQCCRYLPHSYLDLKARSCFLFSLASASFVFLMFLNTCTKASSNLNISSSSKSGSDYEKRKFHGTLIIHTPFHEISNICKYVVEDTIKNQSLMIASLI